MLFLINKDGLNVFNITHAKDIKDIQNQLSAFDFNEIYFYPYHSHEKCNGVIKILIYF